MFGNDKLAAIAEKLRRRNSEKLINFAKKEKLKWKNIEQNLKKD